MLFIQGDPCETLKTGHRLKDAGSSWCMYLQKGKLLDTSHVDGTNIQRMGEIYRAPK